MSFSELSELLSNERSGTNWGVALPGLLERMLETLGSDPGKLDAVASLLEDLRRTQEGRGAHRRRFRGECGRRFGLYEADESDFRAYG